MKTQFTFKRRMEFCETDLAGIVHFSNFYRFMEQTEHEFFRSLGLGIVTKYEDGSALGWPRVSASCSFENPARYEDVLECNLDIIRIGVKSLTLQIVFMCNDVCIARGQMKTVCCKFRHNEPMKSVEIPPPFSDKLTESSYL